MIELNMDLSPEIKELYKGYVDELYKNTGDPITRDEIAFDVYNHYLTHITSYIKNHYSTLDEYIAYINDNTKKLDKYKSLDLSILKRFLFIGWNTEYLVRINDTFTGVDFIRVNNQWKPIQVYYSIYSLAEAACYAIYEQDYNNHTKCLNVMSSYLLTTLIKPWNFHFTGFNGNKKIVSTIIPGNFEKGINIPSPLKRENITSTEVIACCLRAEHRNRIDEYKKPSKGNFPHKYLYEPKPTTLLHFLYRLRIKSNYKNAEVFLANAPDDIIKKFSTNLTQINIYANILFEILIAKKIGKMQLIELMNEFHSIHKNETIIKNRSQHYNNVLD